MIFNPVVPLKKIETIQARDIAVGSSVYLNEGGNYVEYLVVNQGIPSNSNLYDSSCNGTWLLRKDIHSKRVCDTSNVNIYETSEINTWLNSDFFNSLGAVEQTTIKQVKIPYRKNGGPSGTDQSGANGLSCKIFLLSGCEVGGTTSDNQYLPADGAKLDYFESGTGTSANNKRIANYNGTAAYWWLRSPYTDDASYMWHVRTDGDYGIGSVIGLEGVRPALILPFNAEFDNTNMRLVGIGDLQISDYSEGSVIKINENGSPVNFYVAKHNYEPTLNGTGRTLVVRQDVYDKHVWRDPTSSYLGYEDSTIDTWLNSTYKALFDSATQALIGTTDFRVYSTSIVKRSIFLLSVTELAGPGYISGEGDKLNIADMLQIAYQNGMTTTQWTRSISTADSERAHYLHSNGSVMTSKTDFTNGSRPCFTLPANTKVDSNGLIIT